MKTQKGMSLLGAYLNGDVDTLGKCGCCGVEKTYENHKDIYYVISCGCGDAFYTQKEEWIDNLATKEQDPLQEIPWI